MPESNEPDKEILKIAKAGVLGMASAIGEIRVPPEVMIEAALRVLAAFIASGHACQRTRATSELKSLLRRCPPTSGTIEPGVGFRNQALAITESDLY
jgi:hypothetical protein